MSTFFGTLKSSIVYSVLAAALVLPAGVAIAQTSPSSQQIIDALKPKAKPLQMQRPLSRSLSAPAADQPAVAEQANAENAKFVNSLRNRPTRSLSISERQQIATVAETRPRIDLEIKFDYNSANIAKSAIPDMENLGKALSDPSFEGSTFVLAGHTDGVGNDDYNQDLSSRRADTVKNFLVQKYKLSPDHLVTAGFGKTRLKVKEDPKSASNRRVEIVNMAEK